MMLSTIELIVGFILICIGYFGLFYLLGVNISIFLFLIFTGVTFMIESDIRRLNT